MKNNLIEDKINILERNDEISDFIKDPYVLELLPTQDKFAHEVEKQKCNFDK